MQCPVAHYEQVLTRPLTYIAISVESDAFEVAVDDGFHLDELGVHVIGARFGHGRQRVGRDARPGRYADVNALFGIRAQVFSPWIIGDVDLGGRIEWVDTGFAIPAQHDGPDVARPHTIALHQLDQRRDQLFSGVV